MRNVPKQLIILFVITSLFFIPFVTSVPAQEQMEEESKEAGSMTVDLLLIRPFGILATLLGSAAFVVSLPFSAMGGNIEPAYEKMVAEPAAFTFRRPLGSF